MKRNLLTFIILLFAVFSMNAQIFEDGFDTYDDFIITGIGDWTMTDVDGSGTYISSSFTFTNQGYTGVAIVFNPASCDPANPAGWETHTGDKMLVFFNASTPPNDDWLITPQITLTGNSLGFWMKSITDEYGLERFAVGVSTTGTDPADFTIITAGDYVEAPVDWTEYTYDLSTYDGQDVYIGIHCVSNDAFAMFLDDFTVTGVVTTYSVTFNVDMTDSIASGYFVEGTDQLWLAGTMNEWATPGDDAAYEMFESATDDIYTVALDLVNAEYAYKYFKIVDGVSTFDNGEWDGGDNRTFTVAGADLVLNDVFGYLPVGIEELTTAGISIYPNPSNGVFNVNVENNFNLEVFDITGKVINTQVLTGNSTVEINNAGVYFFRFSNENGSVTQRVIVQ